MLIKPSSWDSSPLARRGFIKRAVSAAAIAGSGLRVLLRAADENGGGLLAPKTGHHKAKAENLIVIFLTGGFSHVDTFDYKPALNRYHGQPVPSFGLRSDETGKRPLLGSPFRFASAASRASG